MSRIKDFDDNRRAEGFGASLGKLWEKQIKEPAKFRRLAQDWGHEPDRQLLDRPVQKEVTVGSLPSIKEEADAYRTLYGKKRILFLTHYFYPEGCGGTERFLLQLAEELQRRGLEVLLVTLTKSLERGYATYQGIPLYRIRAREKTPGLYYKKIGPVDWMTKEAEGLLEEFQPDLVHCVYPQPFYSFLMECQKRGIPYGCTLTDLALCCHFTDQIQSSGCLCRDSQEGAKCGKCCPTYGIADYRDRYERSREILQAARFAVAPSYYLAQRLEKEYPGVDVQVIPHGIPRSEAKAKRDSQRTVFLFAGGSTGQKGLDVLRKAFGDLTDQTAELWLCGSKIPKKSGSKNRIRRLGSLSRQEMEEVYHKADCVIIPSLYPESYCFVLNEAVEAGCFVIASDLGALGERTRALGGLVFPVGNQKQLTASMEAFCNNKHEYTNRIFHQ